MSLKKAGVRPMVELGFMPKDLAATIPGVEDYQIHYPGSTISGASNNPPKDYAVWGELVRTYTEHLVQRYGKEQVRYLAKTHFSPGVWVLRIFKDCRATTRAT
jgi:xylan 1,4-beta-xylosidase